MHSHKRINKTEVNVAIVRVVVQLATARLLHNHVSCSGGQPESEQLRGLLLFLGSVVAAAVVDSSSSTSCNIRLIVCATTKLPGFTSSDSSRPVAQ